MSEATTDYRPMWESLGIDLPAHDALLGAIPALYGDAYLAQRNRPEGMPYADFVIIDTDYSVGHAGKLSTRVEAFLEMIQ